LSFSLVPNPNILINAVILKEAQVSSGIENATTDDFYLPKIGNFTRNEEILGRNTSISLGNHFESFIESTVLKGRFSNASEVVRAGLRLLGEEENRIIILRNAIPEGIESGRAIDFNPETHLEILKSRKRNG